MLSTPALSFLWFVAVATPPGPVPVETFGTIRRLTEQHDAASKVALDRLWRRLTRMRWAR